MSTPTSFSAVIRFWSTTAEFASDIRVPYPTAAAMKRRDSIDTVYWQRVIEAAKRRGYSGVNLETLAKLAMRAPKRGKSAA